MPYVSFRNKQTKKKHLRCLLKIQQKQTKCNQVKSTRQPNRQDPSMMADYWNILLMEFFTDVVKTDTVIVREKRKYTITGFSVLPILLTSP